MTARHGTTSPVGTAGARVGFVCRAPGHLDKNGALVDHLTINEKEWAYCPSNVRIEGHDWKPTGGVTLGEIESAIRGIRGRPGVHGQTETKDR